MSCWRYLREIEGLHHQLTVWWCPRCEGKAVTKAGTGRPQHRCFC